MEAQREHILRALQQSGWRIKGNGGAVHILELHPNALWARMKKLGVRSPGTSWPFAQASPLPEPTRPLPTNISETP